jgi:hypothetical protein
VEGWPEGQHYDTRHTTGGYNSRSADLQVDVYVVVPIFRTAIYVVVPTFRSAIHVVVPTFRSADH